MFHQNPGSPQPGLRLHRFSFFPSLPRRRSATILPLLVLSVLTGVATRAQADPCQTQVDEVKQAQAALDNNQDPTLAKWLLQTLAAAKMALGQCRADPPLPAPKTNVGQAMTTIGNYTFLFAVDTDGRILYTMWKLGGGGIGWHEVGGNGRTDAAPAVTAVGDYLFLTVKGLDGNVYLNQGTPPNWVGWR